MTKIKVKCPKCNHKWESKVRIMCNWENIGELFVEILEEDKFDKKVSYTSESDKRISYNSETSLGKQIKKDK